MLRAAAMFGAASPSARARLSLRRFFSRDCKIHPRFPVAPPDSYLHFKNTAPMLRSAAPTLPPTQITAALPGTARLLPQGTKKVRQVPDLFQGAQRSFKRDTASPAPAGAITVILVSHADPWPRSAAAARTLNGVSEPAFKTPCAIFTAADSRAPRARPQSDRAPPPSGRAPCENAARS